MILSIIGIYDQVHQAKQHLALSVNAAGNLSDYAVVDNIFTGRVPTPGNHFFSFPNWPVTVGDIVNLYTCKGRNTTTNVGDWSSHDLFWGLEDSVWNENNTAYVLQIIASSTQQHSTNPPVEDTIFGPELLLRT
jgi:hypothetical protein